MGCGTIRLGLNGGMTISVPNVKMLRLMYPIGIESATLRGASWSINAVSSRRWTKSRVPMISLSYGSKVRSKNERIRRY